MNNGQFVRENKIVWLFFVAMVITIPVLFWFVAVAGYVPLLSLILPMKGSFFFVGLIYVAIYAPIFYFLSKGIAKLIKKISRKEIQYVVIALVLLSFGVMGLIPMYGMGHSSIQYENLYQFYGVYLR